MEHRIAGKADVPLLAELNRQLIEDEAHANPMTVAELEDRDVTASWVTAATQPGTVLVGTREIAVWPVASLGRIVVVEDARRVMKSPSTPTLGVREVALERARRLGIPITFISGAENQCFLPESTEITYKLLGEKNGKQLYRRHVIPNYGHIDCMSGKDAAEKCSAPSYTKYS